MSSKKSNPPPAKPAKKIADSRRVRSARLRAARSALADPATPTPAPFASVAARRPPASGSKATAMTEARQPNPTVTFYGAIPGCRAPMRADPSVLGTLPSRGFQYCEALRAASSFGWYVFPPIDFTLQWDGSAGHLDLPRREGLVSAHQRAVPGLSGGIRPRGAQATARFRAAVSHRGSGAGHRPGLDRAVRRKRARTGAFWCARRRTCRAASPIDLYEGIVETDRWFGPLFTNLRLIKTDVPIHFSTETPLVQVQPLHRSTYAEEVSNRFGVVADLADFPGRRVVALRADHRQAEPRPRAPVGGYAASVRRRRRSGCPVQRRGVNGYLAAAVAVLICASYPVATRAGVTGAFAPQELVTLRFGVGALLFLPYLLLHWRHIASRSLAAGRAADPVSGRGHGRAGDLRPAARARPTTPPRWVRASSPAWVALLGFLVFAKRPSRARDDRRGAVRGGVLVLAWWSASERTPAVLAGDAMFLAASALGALYVLQLRKLGHRRHPGRRDRVAVFRAASWCRGTCGRRRGPLRRIAPVELLWQVLWQGVLIGCVALIALNHAISPAGRRALERAGRAGAGADRDAGARVPRRGPVDRRDRRVRRDLRRRLDRRGVRNAALRRQSGRLQRRREALRPAGYPVRDSAP